MPSASRRVVLFLKTKRDTPWAKTISISAKVRTLAAVASAKARNQNSDAAAPARPASKDGRHRRKYRFERVAAFHHQIGPKNQGLQQKPAGQREGRRHHIIAARRQDRAAIGDGGKPE